MDGKRLIEKIKLRNILSFGDKGEEIILEPLNIIIGQNASGKSNLIDVIKLLKSLIENNDFADFIGRSGGIDEWIWKGKNKYKLAEINVSISNLNSQITYALTFTEYFYKSGITKETVVENKKGRKKTISREKDTDPKTSMLSYIESRKYSENVILLLLSAFVSPMVYSDLQTNRKSEIRYPQDTSISESFLEEDGSNLSLVLNDLELKGDTKDKILDNFKKFNPRVKGYGIKIFETVVQFYVREEGLEKPISAMRLSDGTLRYLCLLAILCHPEPPPLICIEEPETGLHPDILPTIAELMIEASQRTQLIVTT
ncbi:MAG: AAA family ATPase, partial [Acidobacteriota bacterium]